MHPRLPTIPCALLSLLAVAPLARAQPAGTVVGTVDPQPLILFSMQNPPRNHAPATVSAQAALQVRALRALLEVKAPDSAQSDQYRRLRESLFSVARYVLNHEAPAPDPELARSLLPYAGEDLARALAKRDTGFGDPSGPLGERFELYDVARAIRANLRRPDGTQDRGLTLELVRGLTGAIPWEGNRTQRRFLTQFVLHDLVRELWPQLPSSGGHKFQDWIELTQVDGDEGCWIDGLARALTRDGRRKNTARLLARYDQLEAH